MRRRRRVGDLAPGFPGASSNNRRKSGTVIYERRVAAGLTTSAGRGLVLQNRGVVSSDDAKSGVKSGDWSPAIPGSVSASE